MRLVGAESSKTVHQFSTGDEQATGITCIGWASNLITKKDNVTTPKSLVVRWEGLWAEDTPLSRDKNSLDLPRDLTLIDIETSLPKLSVLASGGTS